MTDEEITRNLLGIPEMNRPSFRDSVVAELGFGVVDGTTAPHHVRNIVKACRVRKGGFRTLLQALRSLGIESNNLHYQAIESGMGTVDDALKGTLLPLIYLCDRQAHRDTIDQTLENAQGRFDRPFVFLCHGEKDQGYVSFMDVVTTKSLPLCGLGRQNQNPVHLYELFIPDQIKNEAEFAGELRRRLAKTVFDNSRKSIADLDEEFVKSLGPTLISTHFLASEWRGDGWRRIEEYLKFWDNWPVSTRNYPLVICLGVWLEIRRRPPAPFDWISRLSRQHRIRSKVTAINPANHQKILVTRLPPFQGVQKSEAQTWTAHREVRTLRAGLSKTVGDLYSNPLLVRYDPDDSARIPRIPMERLIEELHRLLDP